MVEKKKTPKWFLLTFVMLLTFFAVGQIRSMIFHRYGNFPPFFDILYYFFILFFCLIMPLYFLIRKYEIKSWLIPFLFVISLLSMAAMSLIMSPFPPSNVYVRWVIQIVFGGVAFLGLTAYPIFVDIYYLYHFFKKR